MNVSKLNMITGCTVCVGLKLRNASQRTHHSARWALLMPCMRWIYLRYLLRPTCIRAMRCVGCGACGAVRAVRCVWCVNAHDKTTRSKLSLGICKIGHFNNSKENKRVLFRIYREITFYISLLLHIVQRFFRCSLEDNLNLNIIYWLYSDFLRSLQIW